MAKATKSIGMPAAIEERPPASSGAPAAGVSRQADVLLYDYADALDIVPEQYHTNLYAYFSSSPGKYKLQSFLDSLSDMWLKAGLRILPRLDAEHPFARSAGAFENDPTWNDMIEENEKSQEDPILRPWTREEYYKAGEQGIFGPEERLELIDGEIFRHMSPIGVPHSTAVERVRRCVERAFGDGFFATSAHPLTIDDHGEPEPDLIVAVGTLDDYEDHHPGPSEVRLVVEVSDTSLRFDRKTKTSVYARAGIPEYWIVNLQTRQLLVQRSPASTGSYSEVVELSDADTVTPLHAPTATIAVSDLFPKKR